MLVPDANERTEGTWKRTDANVIDFVFDNLKVATCAGEGDWILEDPGSDEARGVVSLNRGLVAEVVVLELNSGGTSAWGGVVEPLVPHRIILGDRISRVRSVDRELPVANGNATSALVVGLIKGNGVTGDGKIE